MRFKRRDFLKVASTASLSIPFVGCGPDKKRHDDEEQALISIANEPVLKTDTLKQPLIITSMELLKLGDVFFVRTRTKDGPEGISVTNAKVSVLYPVFLELVAPFFIGKDARQLEKLLD